MISPWIFSGRVIPFRRGEHSGLRTLDVSATIDASGKKLSLFVINRSLTETLETTISLADASFAGEVAVSVCDGPDIKAENSFEQPEQVTVTNSKDQARGSKFVYAFPPHSVTSLIFDL